MIEVKIPKEINKYEARFIGPFTMRQSIALIVAMPACVLIYNFGAAYIPEELLFIFLLIPAGLAYLFGWAKPYGMKIEQFLGNAFITAFVAPTKRKYVTENYYSFIVKKIKDEEKGADENKRKKSFSKTYRRSKEAIK